MKKFLKVFILITIITTIFINFDVVKGNCYQKSIAKKIIRFHVIANSDSVQDQALKIKVKNEVLQYISPKLKNCKSIEDSRKILIENDAEIKRIAREVITESEYSYNVTTELSKENFPIKSYGNITLPQGEYEAYRIIIGSGRGQNWWCVMFPPLCFIDVTKGETAYEETKKAMDKVLTDEELESITNSIDIKEKTKSDEQVKLEPKIQFKFKIVEIFKNFISN